MLPASGGDIRAWLCSQAAQAVDAGGEEALARPPLSHLPGL